MAYSPNKKAYYRGFGVRSASHKLEWYKNALSQYSDAERAAFLDGYTGRPYTATMEEGEEEK